MRASDLHADIRLLSKCDGQSVCLLDVLPGPVIEEAASTQLQAGDHVEAMHAADDDGCVLTLSISDISTLQQLRDHFLSGEFEHSFVQVHMPMNMVYAHRHGSLV